MTVADKAAALVSEHEQSVIAVFPAAAVDPVGQAVQALVEAAVKVEGSP